MAKLALVPVLFVIACVFAGTYGAVHDQISYTVAPEYFTQFKFHQFHIADETPDRIGAAIVGWNAAWWMGIVIGIILIPLGLVIQGAAHYFWGMIRVLMAENRNGRHTSNRQINTTFSSSILFYAMAR